MLAPNRGWASAILRAGPVVRAGPPALVIAARTAEETALTVRPERPLSLAFLGDPNSIHLRRWIAFFAERGHRIDLLVPTSEPITVEQRPDVRVTRFSAYPRTRIRGLGALITRRSLRRVLRDIRPDVLHAHYLGRYGWMAHLSGFQPYTITVWGSDVFRSQPTSWWARRRTRLALRDARLVTAVSQDLADGAVRLGARPERIRIVQFGIDPERFAPGDPPPDLRAMVGAVGRRVLFSPRALRPLYRQEVVVAALAELPEDVVALFSEAGQDRACRARLESDALALGVAERLRFVPAIPHEKMADHYRLADVVVSVPETDAFPVTALEAMACGRPVVLSDVPSAHEGLAAVDPAAIVPVGDARATAAAVRARLELGSAARADLAARLRDAAIARGDMRASLLRMEEEYRRLLTLR